jgi:hypothetical protein
MSRPASAERDAASAPSERAPLMKSRRCESKDFGKETPFGQCPLEASLNRRCLETQAKLTNNAFFHRTIGHVIIFFTFDY